jgi:hypothetical protein
MKNTYYLQKLIFLLFLSCYTAGITAQNVFWSDSFDAPAGGTNNNNNGQGWTLNSGGNGGNNWFINTPSQTIGCSSTGNMLHISCNDFICSFLGGPNDPIYGAAASNNRSAVSPNISTVGAASPALSFEFICEGIPGEDYGLLAFSNDGGTTWTEFPERYEGVSTCSLITIPLTATFQNISNFKMRFRWIESNASNGLDPAFSVDNIKLSTNSAVCVPPTVNAGNNVSICGGQSVTLGGTPTATGGTLTNYVYSWSPAAGLSASNVANPTANPTQTTSYTVTVHGGDANCSATSTVTVTVGSAPNVSITPSGPTTICPGTSVQLNATAGLSNYTWTTPTGSQSGASIQATLSGNYTVTAQSGTGCSGTSSPLTVTVQTIPNLSTNPSGNVSLCVGQNLPLTASAGFTNYTWITPSGQALGQTINASQAGTYTASAQFQGCSVQAAPITVTEGSTGSISITVLGSSVLCEGESVVLTAPAGFQNYLWSNGATGSSTTIQTEQTVSVSASIQGCTVTSEPVFIAVSTPLPITASISGPSALCPGAITELQSSAGFTDYVWTGPTTTLNGQNITVGEAGSYNVSATDINGCTSESNTLQLTAIQTPTLTVTPTGPVSICDGETATLTASVGFGNYLWNTPTGTVAGQSIEASEEGNYSVQAVYSSCTLNSPSVFVAVQSAPTLGISLNGSTTVCSGESVVLTAEDGYDSYLWSNGATTQSITVSTSGSYFVTAAAELGCDAVSNDVVISIIQPPTAAFTYDQIEPQNTVQFTYTGAFANDFTWIFGGGVTSTNQNPIYQFPFEGTWPVTLIATNPCGSDTLESEVEVIKIGFEDIDGVSVDVLNDGEAWILRGSSVMSEPLALEVFCVDGRKMRSMMVKGNAINERIAYENYPSGVYLLVMSRGGQRATVKMLKR